jgi:N-acyl-D-aspartate/D-glutamate deacylase
LSRVPLDALRPLIGKTIAEIAGARGVSPEDGIVDLVIEDDAGESAAYEDVLGRRHRGRLPGVQQGLEVERSTAAKLSLIGASQ